MLGRLLCAFACLGAGVAVSAFSTVRSTPPSRYALQMRSWSSPAPRLSADSVAEASEDTDDVTCYVVNDEEIVTEGEKPHVVCTSEPDDYAWFEGIDPKNMRVTDGTEEGGVECVESENFRGKPEWECE
ncbi:hypothetical protein ACHAXT_006104 [Thalassiosira profunda]